MYAAVVLWYKTYMCCVVVTTHVGPLEMEHNRSVLKRVDLFARYSVGVMQSLVLRSVHFLLHCRI